jgi:hypothetical protein
MNRLAEETSPYLLQHALGVACDADQKRRGGFATRPLEAGWR